jgi:hypothetical protein
VTIWTTITDWSTIATDWATISSLATAGGTLVLATATFASVRSANRSARLAELALQEQVRPVLVHSNLEDPVQKIMFADGRWLRAGGGGAAVEEADGTVYLALSVRNVGSGIAVLQGWYAWPSLEHRGEAPVAVEEFRLTTRDLYIPAGSIGLWQGALRDSSEEIYQLISSSAAGQRPFMVDLLYSDLMGGQRSISRFSLTPAQDRWVGAVARHWNLDRAGPRDGGSVPSGRAPMPPFGPPTAPPSGSTPPASEPAAPTAEPTASGS